MPYESLINNSSLRGPLRRQRRLRLTPLIGALLLLIIIVFFWPHPSAGKPNPTVLISQLVLPDLPKKLASLPKLASKTTKIQLATKAAILVDGATNTVLYQENGEEPVPIASTTKLMTAILARQNLDLNKVITITKEATQIIGSDMNLRSGEAITVRGLLAGLLISSGNDAAYTFASDIGPTVPDFVTKMNAMANKLGMKDTHYADPAGLDDTGRSTARDLAIIARAALRDSVLADLVRTKEMTVTSTDGSIRHDLKNSNRLVGEYDYPGAIGLKTGFTPEAGHCLVAGAERDGHQLIAVILHTDAETITASAIEARKLLDWGWTNTVWSTPIAQ